MATILAFEEERLREDELKIALQTPGHQLLSFSNHLLALEYLSSHEVELLLCNVHLQNTSSFEVLRMVRDNPKNADLPFLFYCIEPSDLTKPFVGSILMAAKRLGATDVILLERYDAKILCVQVERYLPAWVERKCAK